MPNYHDPLDIMPFPNETQSVEGYVSSDHQKKESFIDHLLKQYIAEQKQKGPATSGDEILTTLKKDIDRLQSTVMSMESKLAALHQVNAPVPVDMSAMGEKFDRLYEEIQGKVASYLKKLEQFVPVQEDMLKRVQGDKGNTLQEKRLRVLKYYESENVRLKQLNMKLMRLEYEKRIQQRSEGKTVSVGGSAPSGKDLHEINYLLNEIKKLEMK